MTQHSVITVDGPIAPEEAGVADAHNHVWIAPVPGVSGAPVLDDRNAITAELIDYRQAGGGTIIDCQPGSCGRDGRVLRELARASGVHIVACTGFHRQRYYPAEHWLFHASGDEAQAYFVRELTEGLEETHEADRPVRAGFIKAACEASLEQSPVALLEAAAGAGLATGAALEIHTEKGADAERIVDLLRNAGLGADRIVLCHMDKRPDHALHRALAQEGVMLEYDTFYRPKYRPEENLWPLLEHMVAEGLDDHVAIATDIAGPEMWSRLGNGAGLSGLLTQIMPKLEMLGFETDTVRRLTGANIAARLARPHE